eukprot:5969431-Pyramimonas_sp.AAC.1
MSLDPLAWTPTLRSSLPDDLSPIGIKFGKDGVSAESSNSRMTDHVGRRGTSTNTSTHDENIEGGDLSSIRQESTRIKSTDQDSRPHNASKYRRRL